MRNKEDFEKLEEEIKTLFLNANIKPPKRILPIIITDNMDAILCFKTRMRTLLSENSLSKNFEGLDQDGNFIMKDNYKQEEKIMFKNEEFEDTKKQIILHIKNKLGIDITKF